MTVEAKMKDWENETVGIERVTDANLRFLATYSDLLPVERRGEFQRDLIYLIHLIYREAQVPLVKQMTDFVVYNTTPQIIIADPRGDLPK